MDYIFTKMSQGQAEEIAVNWHYDDVYAFYDIAADEEDLAEFLNSEKREDKYFVVTAITEVIGFYCFEHENECVDMGLGMKPEFTGQGLGMKFLMSGLTFAKASYNPEIITLSVATFNTRAIKLYTNAGFTAIGSFMQETNGSQFEFLRMNYECVK